MFDKDGNLVESQFNPEEMAKQQKTSYFILKCCRMPLSKYINILMVILLVSMFMERFFFAVIVYKTKNYGYALLLLVLFFNSIFLYIMIKLRQKKVKKQLFEAFATSKEQNVSWVIIAIVG